MSEPLLVEDKEFLRPSVLLAVFLAESCSTATMEDHVTNPQNPQQTSEIKPREAVPEACCSANEQATCCEPSAKAGCCGPRAAAEAPAPSYCGCR
jgi:hypothetical protein